MAVSVLCLFLNLPWAGLQCVCDCGISWSYSLTFQAVDIALDSMIGDVGFVVSVYYLQKICELRQLLTGTTIPRKEYIYGISTSQELSAEQLVCTNTNVGVGYTNLPCAI